MTAAVLLLASITRPAVVALAQLVSVAVTLAAALLAVPAKGAGGSHAILAHPPCAARALGRRLNALPVLVPTTVLRAPLVGARVAIEALVAQAGAGVHPLLSGSALAGPVAVTVAKASKSFTRLASVAAAVEAAVAAAYATRQARATVAAVLRARGLRASRALPSSVAEALALDALSVSAASSGARRCARKARTATD